MTRWTVRAIVFDFDGVLVDSNRIKWDAFSQVLGASHRASVARVLRTGRELPRRMVFFKVLSECGLRGTQLDREVERHVRGYSDIVTTAIEKRGLLPGTLPLLAKWASRYSLYVGSATPHRELRLLLRRVGVFPYLRGAFGWPHAKAETIHRILRSRMPARELLFVGDGKGDRRAARATGCRFVGIANEFNRWAIDRSRNQIRNVRELDALLDRRLAD